MNKEKRTFLRAAARKLISQYPNLSLTELKKIYRYEYTRASLSWGNFITRGEVEDCLKEHMENNKDVLELLKKH
jgi:hypothetical protein